MNLPGQDYMSNKVIQPYTNPAADYVDLRSLLHSLLVKKRLIAAIALSFLALSLLYSAARPTRYQSSILLKIQHKQQTILGSINTSNQPLGLANMAEEPLAVQIALIKSEFILNPVIESLGLDVKVDRHAKKITIPESEVLNQLQSNLNITDLSGTADNSLNKAAILRLTLTGLDPSMINQTLNQIALTIQQKNIKLKAIEAEKALAFIKQQLPSVRKELQNAELKLNLYRATNGKTDIKFQKEYLLSHLTELNNQLEKAKLLKINLLQKYTDNYPAVISVNDEISALAANQQAFIDQLKKLPALEQETTNLRREVDVHNNLYTILISQIHELEVVKTGMISDIQVLSYSTHPTILQPVKISMIGLAGLLVGLIIGCIGVLSWNLFNKKITVSGETLAHPASYKNSMITELHPTYSQDSQA